MCCGTGPNVSITIFDAIRIAKRIDVSIDDFIRTYVRVILADMIPVMSLAGDMKGRCVFLGFDADGKTYCKIYDSRPMKCRIYPLKVVRLDGSEIALDEECPGVGRGKEVKPPADELKKYIEELREHYRILAELIVEKGEEPLRALREALLYAKKKLEGES